MNNHSNGDCRWQGRPPAAAYAASHAAFELKKAK
jgi:hypothetical protein